MRKTSVASVLVLAAAGSFAVGCNQTDDTNGGRTGTKRAALHHVKDCNELGQMLKEDALAKMNAAIDAQIEQVKQYGNGGGYYGPPQADASSDGGMGTGAPGAAGSGNESAEDRAEEYSETNTQVAGVDEADIIKTDGQNLYLLHGQSFLTLRAWPASSLAQQSSFAIEGQPLEMYVTDEGKVVIYSTVDGGPIYAEAGIEPREQYSDYYYGYGGGMDVGMPYPGGYYYSSPLTKLTVLTLQDAQPVVESELYFEGSYTSSRRVDQYVRTVLQGAAYGPQLEYWPSTYPQTQQELIAALEQLRAANAAKINASGVEDWLPYMMLRGTDGSLKAHLAQCDEFYVPTAGSTNYGMTQVQSIDLRSPGAVPRGASIVGQVNTVYSSTGAMYLAAQGWVDPGAVVGVGSSGGGTVTDPVESPPPDTIDAGAAEPATDPNVGQKASALNDEYVSTSVTHIHKFDLTIDPSRPEYVASGSVSGWIVNQFSLDEHEGHFRVTTTDDLYKADTWESLRINNLFVMATQGDELNVVGSVEGLAEGERIYSTRFMGDKAYVVTFRQVDPLFAIDLSNPAAPKVLGELKIPGFSEYMHPIDDTHLLTIGQEDSSTMLQIFDVSNPVEPQLAHKFQFSGAEYGYSEAQNNHKAFTYFAARKLLAFPFVGYSSTDYTMRSSLEVFSVDINTGFNKLGSVEHSSFFGPSDQYGYCGGYYGADVRRGVFMENFVYSVSYGGVIVNDVADLTTPVASLALEAPVNTAYCGGYYE